MPSNLNYDPKYMQVYSDGSKLYPPNLQNVISVVMAASEEYLPYAAVTIHSMLRHGSTTYHYDLILLHQHPFSPQGMAILWQVVKEWDNCTLRLLQVSNMETCYVSGHVSTETYVRLMLPELLPNYDKVLYLDSDLVVLKDISNLWSQPVDDGVILAGVQDFDVIGQYYGTEFSMRYYIDHTLKLTCPEHYIQAGVLCFFLNTMRSQLDSGILIRTAAGSKLRYFDQDILNAICHKKIALLDCRWNVVSDCDHYRVSHIIAQAPNNLFHSYMQSRQDPWIIHYSGYRKPWDFPQEDLATYFTEEVHLAHLEQYVYGQQGKNQKSFWGKKWLNYLLPRQSIRREFIKSIYFCIQYRLEQ